MSAHLSHDRNPMRSHSGLGTRPFGSRRPDAYSCQVRQSVPPFFWLPSQGEPPNEYPPSGALGHDLGTWIVEQAGKVWSIDPQGELPTRYVCASVAVLQRMLDVLAERGMTIAKLSDNEAEKRDRVMESTLAEIDPTALADPDNWWSLVVEQCVQGLL